MRRSAVRKLCVECGKVDSVRHICRTDHHARAAELAVLYRGGCTLKEIGDAVGLTPERVRQLIRSVGEPVSNRGSRRSTSIAPLVVQVTQKVHRGRLRIGRQQQLHASTERRAQRFAQAVEAVRILHRTLGRSPTIAEVARALGLRPSKPVQGGPYLHAWLGRRKGERFRDVMFALYDTAGVPQRGVGGPGHLDHKAAAAKRAATFREKPPRQSRRQTTCRRGHNDWYVHKAGRQCAACKREYMARRYAAQKVGVR